MAMTVTRFPPRRMRAVFVAEPGVNAIRSFRALLKVALRRFGLRAIDTRELHARDLQDQPQPGRLPMTAFSDRVRGQKKGFFKVADFEGGKETILTISHLDEQVELFGKEVDVLNFVETGRQLQLNQTTSEFLLDNFGEDPANFAGNKVVLHLGEYEYNREKKLGIRLKLPGTPHTAHTPARSSSAGDGTLPVKRARSADLDDEVPF
jgi:hypothetical protein